MPHFKTFRSDKDAFMWDVCEQLNGCRSMINDICRSMFSDRPKLEQSITSICYAALCAAARSIDGELHNQFRFLEQPSNHRREIQCLRKEQVSAAAGR